MLKVQFVGLPMREK